MSFPPGAITVTVTKDYRRADGSFPSVAIGFQPSSRHVETGDYTIEPVPVTKVVLDGQLSVQLFVTEGFSYWVSELVDGVRFPRYSVLIPNAGTVELDSLAAVEPVIPQYTPVRTVEGIGPDPTGNIDLPPAAGADPAGTAAGLVSAHAAASDPHAQYLTQTEGDARYVQPADLAGKEDVGVAAAGDSAHAAASDPHSQYLTTAEGNAAYATIAALSGKENTGVAATADAIHVAAGDPHPQYLTASEGNAAYSALGHTHTQADVSGLVAALSGKAARAQTMSRVVSSGDVPLNTAGSSWAPLAASPTLSVPAAVGDQIGLDLGSAMRTTGSSNKYLDVAVVVSGQLRRMLGNGLTGTPVVVPTTPPEYEGMAVLYHTNFPAAGGSFRFLATANDIDGSGNVTVSFACRSVGSDSPVLCAGTANPLVWSLSNLGPVTSL